MKKRAIGLQWNKLALFAVFAIILFLLCYFRLKPIYLQTLPYTFDQGRDFLKVHEIIADRNPTFIGPTTGVNGIYHGAWWYYYLIIPYLVFQGHPSGFYLFTFLTFLAVSIGFFIFLKREFNDISALIFLTFAATSPYLIQISVFVISSFPILPLLLILFYSTYQFLKKGSHVYLFLTFLSLSFIFEAELPTGAFLIPAFVLTIIISGHVKEFFAARQKLFSSFAGIFIPMIPRLLFEVKNNFSQTRTILSFLTHQVGAPAKTLREVFLERVDLFWFYYVSLFPEKNIILAILTLMLGVFGLTHLVRKNGIYKKYVIFILTLLITLFLLTLLYKNVFWANYLEGLSLFYALLLVLGFYGLTKNSHKLLKKLPIFVFVILLGFSLNNFYKDIFKRPKLEGMKEQILAVQHIYKQTNRNETCTRVYTPPVIPHTYNYLFTYYEKRAEKKIVDYFVDKKCWYIIEKDQYKFRVDEWRKNHIPLNSELLTKQKISEKIVVEEWKEGDN